MVTEDPLRPHGVDHLRVVHDGQRARVLPALRERGEDVDTIADADRAAERVLGRDWHRHLPTVHRTATHRGGRDQRVAGNGGDEDTTDQRVRAVVSHQRAEHRTVGPHPRHAQVAPGDDVVRGKVARRGEDGDGVVGRREEAQPSEHRDRDEHDAEDQAAVDPPESPGPATREDAAERAHRASPGPVTGAGTLRPVPARNGTHRKGLAVVDRPRFLQPAEVADVLNVTVSQVYTLMRSGQLPAVKIGKRGVWRVSAEALEAYIAELEREADARRASR